MPSLDTTDIIMYGAEDEDTYLCCVLSFVICFFYFKYRLCCSMDPKYDLNIVIGSLCCSGVAC